jgi:hypothetical protein
LAPEQQDILIHVDEGMGVLAVWVCVVGLSFVKNGAIFVWCMCGGPLVVEFSEISFVICI